jgi:hypothetical protein
MTLASSVQAFEAARERASIAQALQMTALHRVIREAREQGMSMRECARLLRMSKSEVQRHSRSRHECTKSLPVWGSPDGWIDAYRAVWAHDPEMLACESVPFAWEDDGAEGRIIRLLEWKVIPGRR